MTIETIFQYEKSSPTSSSTSSNHTTKR